MDADVIETHDLHDSNTWTSRLWQQVQWRITLFYSANVVDEDKRSPRKTNILVFLWKTRKTELQSGAEWKHNVFSFPHFNSMVGYFSIYILPDMKEREGNM